MGCRLFQFLSVMWRQWLRPVIIVVALLFSLRSAVADWYQVPTGSMNPNIVPGDRIFVNKLAYDFKVPFAEWQIVSWADPERFDVVVFREPRSERKFVKRVVGLPGDVIELHNNRLIVNGRALAYGRLWNRAAPFADSGGPAGYLAEESLDEHVHEVMITPGVSAHRTFGPQQVPADQYFVMGDNRDRSADSRAFGLVGRERIVGRTTWVVLSLDPANHNLPRSERFFRAIP